MITERLMEQGEWSIELDPATPTRVLDALAFFGHVIVTPSRVDSRRLSSTAMMNLARYTGVVRNRVDRRILSGPGLAVWLGVEDGLGSIIYPEPLPGSGTFTQWILDLQPATLYAGNVDGSVPSTLLSYRPNLVTRRNALDYVSQAFATEWRIRPGGSLDAGYAAFLFEENPKVVVMRGGHGRDGAFVGLEATRLPSKEDVEEYVRRVLVMGEGPGTVVGEDELFSTPENEDFVGLTGSDLDFTLVLSAPSADAGEAQDLATSALANRVGVRRGVDVAVRAFDVRRDLEAGDWVYVYDPANGLSDDDNKIVYRGQQISPVKLRCYAVTWPVEAGMGVYYRDRAGVFTDLTDWVMWETGADTELEVGAATRPLIGGSPVLGGPPEIVDRLNQRGMVRLHRDVLTAAAASWTSPPIDGVDGALLVRVKARDNSANVVNTLIVQVNGDATANYDYQYDQGNNATNTAGGGTGVADTLVGLCAGGGSVANVFATTELTIPDYASTGHMKKGTVETGFTDGTLANGIIRNSAWGWRGTGPITSITVKSSAGSLVAGTTIEILRMG